jgi:5-carboxymethyl-2-hydroxymuconic-semialdehyde dehydrogenase
MIKHWINGREVESKEVFETVNPATGEVITEVASGGADEINAAVAAAKEAFPSGPAPRPRNAPGSCAVWAS